MDSWPLWLYNLFDSWPLKVTFSTLRYNISAKGHAKEYAKGHYNWLPGWSRHFQGQTLCIPKRDHYILSPSCSTMKKWILDLLTPFMPRIQKMVRDAWNFIYGVKRTWEKHIWNFITLRSLVPEIQRLRGKRQLHRILSLFPSFYEAFFGVFFLYTS